MLILKSHVKGITYFSHGDILDQDHLAQNMQSDLGSALSASLVDDLTKAALNRNICDYVDGISIWKCIDY